MPIAATFIHRWRQRAVRSTDPFDQFFSAWLALVIAAQRWHDVHSQQQPRTDRIAVIQFLKAHADLVASALAAIPSQVDWLSRRTGTATGERIVDVIPPRPLRQRFDVLADVWAGHANRNPTWVAESTAELVNHIRNNVFHGVKAPDDTADQQLLQRANSILLSVLQTLEDAGVT